MAAVNPHAEGAKKDVAKTAKVSKLKSNGAVYTQVWIPREVGDQLERDARYSVKLSESATPTYWRGTET